MGVRSERTWIRGLLCVALLGSVSVTAGDAEPASRVEDPKTEPAHGISGRVADPEGAPVAGATVWVRAKRFGTGNKYKFPGQWLEPVSASTAEDGSFTVRIDDEGPYVVFVLHPEHPARAVPGDVEDGAVVDFAFPEPVAYSGRVVDASGEAVRGADVNCCGREASSFGAFACRRTRSGEDGTFTFDKLAGGTYGFQAWAPGYALSRVERGRLPLDERPGHAPGALRLERGAEVSGTVTDDEGTALAGVEVHYATDRVRLGQARGRTDVQPLNAIFTDEKGQFTLRGLPAGERLKLFANASEHRAAESETLTLGEGAVLGGITIVHRRPASAKVRLVDVDDVPVGALDVLWLAVKEGPRKSEGGFRVAGFEGLTVVESEGQGRFAISQIEPGRYDVTLLPDGYQAIRIEGLNVPAGARLDWGTRIVQPGATLSGYVVNDLGDAIEKATLRATYLREGTATSRTATSETDGRFVLGGLPDGALLWLRVEAEGHGPFMEQDVGTGQSDYEVTLERVGAITGIVSLESGDPPEGVTATLEPVAGGPISFGRRKQEAVGADGDGRFEIKDAAPGDYHVRLTAKGARPLRVKGVTVTAGDSIDIGTHRLEQGRSISGSVLDARNGAPVTGAAINVEARGGGLTGSISSLGAATTDADGRFEVDGLEPGRLVLDVEHVGYAPAKLEALLEEDAPTDELTIRLGQGGTLRGTVRDDSGRPAEMRSVGVIEGGGFVPRDELVRTDEAGEYRVERMRPGSYRVVLYPDPSSGNAMEMRQKSATIRENEETIVDFDNEARIAFEGLLTRGGRPVGDVTVMLVPTDAGGLMRTRTATVDLSGRFEVGLNRPGAYNVVVQDLARGRGTLVGQTRIEVPDEPHVSQEIALQSGTIAGTVFDADGQPITGAVVSAVLSDGGPGDFGSRTGAGVEADGSFRIEGAGDGTYALSAVADGYQVATRSVTISGSSTVDGIDFRLEIAGVLRGRVVDVHGTGVSGAFVFASIAGAPGGAGAMPAESDAEGFFRVSAPSEGPCDLEAVARGFAPGGVRGFQPSTNPDDPGARITLTAGGTLMVRVVDSAGQAVEGAQPALHPERASQALAVAMMFSPIPPTDASGLSVVRGLGPGDYRISVAGKAELPARKVSVSDGTETTVTLQLP